MACQPARVSSISARAASTVAWSGIMTYSRMEPIEHFLSKNECLIAEIEALRAGGLSLRQIAARKGMSHPSVLRLLVTKLPLDE
jgi:hypothetical protein